MTRSKDLYISLNLKFEEKKVPTHKKIKLKRSRRSRRPQSTSPQSTFCLITLICQKMFFGGGTLPSPSSDQQHSKQIFVLFCPLNVQQKRPKMTLHEILRRFCGSTVCGNIKALFVPIFDICSTFCVKLYAASKMPQNLTKCCFCGLFKAHISLKML